jgi:hypothetical protein
VFVCACLSLCVLCVGVASLWPRFCAPSALRCWTAAGPTPQASPTWCPTSAPCPQHTACHRTTTVRYSTSKSAPQASQNIPSINQSIKALAYLTKGYISSVLSGACPSPEAGLSGDDEPLYSPSDLDRLCCQASKEAPSACYTPRRVAHLMEVSHPSAPSIEGKHTFQVL